ncbi:formate dehydrogenase accessory sulfurtransferase FdhD [Virgibacillus kekensis]|uniref:Sulfur carrier protein FdhD n=1 Tax=Virgibacillus kekensis TaxID=202261 RepID=A0ABV9DIB4_9BACI
MSQTPTNKWKVIKFDEDSLNEIEEEVAAEFPLTVMVNGEEFATMVCTPENLHELVVGFLASEGLIRSYSEIKSVHIDDSLGFAHVMLYRELDEDRYDHSKRFIGSCCGKSRQFYFKSDVQTAKTVMSKMSLSIEQGISLMKLLEEQSNHFQRTGGVHNAALCTSDGIEAIRTDIGRHNALDKIYGYALQNRVRLADKLIVFSGRISSEVLLKISKIGVGILLSKSAPTDLALKLADDLGITAIGFARKRKMNVYTHPERIAEAKKYLT